MNNVDSNKCRSMRNELGQNITTWLQGESESLPSVALSGVFSLSHVFENSIVVMV